MGTIDKDLPGQNGCIPAIRCSKAKPHTCALLFPTQPSISGRGPDQAQEAQAVDSSLRGSPLCDRAIPLCGFLPCASSLCSLNCTVPTYRPPVLFATYDLHRPDCIVRIQLSRAECIMRNAPSGMRRAAYSLEGMRDTAVKFIDNRLYSNSVSIHLCGSRRV